MVRAYHFTTPEAAASIRAGEFRTTYGNQGTGVYLTDALDFLSRRASSSGSDWAKKRSERLDVEVQGRPLDVTRRELDRLAAQWASETGGNWIHDDDALARLLAWRNADYLRLDREDGSHELVVPDVSRIHVLPRAEAAQ